MNFVFGRASGHFGNAILSKYQIEEAKTELLKIETYEGRSAIILKCFHFNLVAVHFDVGNEDIRLKQYDILCKKLIKDEILKKSTIFLGDFNSLRIEDYSR